MLPTKTTGQRWDCQFLPTGEGLQHFLVWLHQQSPDIQTYTSLEMMLDPLDKPSPVLNRPLLMGRFCHRAQEIGCGGVTDIGLESWPWVRWPFSNKECSWQKWKYCHNFGCSVFRCLQAMNNDGNTTNDPSHSFSDSRVCSTIPCVSVEQTS